MDGSHIKYSVYNVQIPEGLVAWITGFHQEGTSSTPAMGTILCLSVNIQ